MSKVRVRYAPSPTGYLHIGGARTALFNYLFAKKYNGTFIVRIEDTDLQRNIVDGESSQLDNLKWLGLEIDESPVDGGNKGPYRQSERLPLYQKYIDQLLEKKKAYYCFCTPEELKTKREAQKKAGIPNPQYDRTCFNLDQKVVDNNIASKKSYAIRLHIEDDVVLKWNDMVRGEVSFKGSDVGDIVILKNNKIPTYNFAVVVDDYLMEISHVLRGEEHISNTPKQLFIYQCLGIKPPIFGHLTIITDLSGKKLSKRDESIFQFLSQYKEKGFLPQAMFNFLNLLGWAPKEEKEIYSKEELIAIFDEKRFSKSPSCFDYQKLEWMNAKYLKKMREKPYLDFITPFAKKKYPQIDFTTAVNQEILYLCNTVIKFGDQIGGKMKLFFEDKVVSEESKKFLLTKDFSNLFASFKKHLNNLKKWDKKGVASALQDTSQETGCAGKDLFMPIRAQITGQIHGPNLTITLFLLGKEKVLSNL